MEKIATPLNDCYIIKTPVFGDERGFFLESFNVEKLAKLQLSLEVKQINFAKSQKNVLRGLHYQLAPYSQTKLVGVIAGAVYDVVVDIRKNSSTYGKSFGLKIEDQGTMLLVPKGFAHGYHTLNDDTIFYYAVDHGYAPEFERGILWNDQDLGIDWGDVQHPLISPKDLKQPIFAHAEINFD